MNMKNKQGRPTKKRTKNKIHGLRLYDDDNIRLKENFGSLQKAIDWLVEDIKKRNL